jgi:hypothetical protein
MLMPGELFIKIRYTRSVMKKLLFTLLLALPLVAQEPGQIVGVGMGVTGVGHFKGFGYFSLSQHVADKTYITAISEYVRLKDNTMSICPRAGATHIMWEGGSAAFGFVGDAGACESTIGNTTGFAISGRGFVSYRIKKSSYFIIVSGETIKTQGGNLTPLVTLGLHKGISK